MIVALPGVRLHVRLWSSEGPPIVLLHGLSSNAHIWDAVAPSLARRFRVLAPDQRGHGSSDKPDDDYGFPPVVGDLRALAATLGLERPLLVGHSWGGNVVLEYAATHPGDVAGLVLVDGGFIELASDPEMTWERVRGELAPPDLTRFTLDELLGRMRHGDAGAYWSEAVVATVRGSFEVGPDGKVQPRLTLENHLRILRALWEQRPVELARQVRCPVLIVPARRAAPTGRGVGWQVARERQVERVAAAMPRARVVWLDDTVHDVPLQRPRELAELIAAFADETSRTFDT